MRVPLAIKKILEKLEKEGHEAYAVGGCVRDLLLGKKPEDWDIATSAKPEKIQKIFPESFYENTFGTVTVENREDDDNITNIEITTFRAEADYQDKRHPEKVEFVEDLEQDLARRDFTINAIALKKDGELIDPHHGQKDLKERLIRAVGKAEDRFAEDALRMLRAIRFSKKIEGSIEKDTGLAIKKNAKSLEKIAKERIRDEFTKMIMGKNPDQAIEDLRQYNLLSFIVPELEKGVGVGQNRHHVYTIYQHSVLALKYAAERDYGLEIRLAALFHDIAKPQTKAGEGIDSTFYNHDIVGAKFTAAILERLRFPKKVTKKVSLLVRYHMFVYDVEEVTEAGVRRLLRKVGKENIEDLISLRVADRLGSGCPKAVPYKLRHLRYVIERVSQDPISTKMLKVDGNDIMKELGIEPGPKLGLIMEALLAEALEDPQINNKKDLIKLSEKLNNLSQKELREKTKKVKEKKQEIDLKMKGKYWLK